MKIVKMIRIVDDGEFVWFGVPKEYGELFHTLIKDHSRKIEQFNHAMQKANSKVNELQHKLKLMENKMKSLKGMK